MQRRIGIIALSAIADDPRVRRQGQAFHDAGWDVVAIGLPGARSHAPDWPILDHDSVDQTAPPLCTVDAPAPLESAEVRPRSPGSTAALRLALRRLPLARVGVRHARQIAGHVFAHVARRRYQARHFVRLQAPRIWPDRGEVAYWSLNDRFSAMYRSASQVRADLWLANDWTALPIARRLAREQEAVLAYDTHELAADEYEQRWRWRLLHRPTTVAVERECLKEAGLVTCVSEGIADRLAELYSLPEKPLVVRNTPPFEAMPFRATGGTIEVLYHGVVCPGRGLEEAIRSVPAWRPEYRLTIRGPASDTYRALLDREIQSLGVSDRVTLAPPVPMVDLVREANLFDIGLLALPGHSRHNRFALPNKVFEYAMAGLALCISDLPEMSKLTAQYGFGKLIASMHPGAIAAAINSFDRATIDACKRKALEAARELNWGREQHKLVSRCSSLIAAREGM